MVKKKSIARSQKAPIVVCDGRQPVALGQPFPARARVPQKRASNGKRHHMLCSGRWTRSFCLSGLVLATWVTTGLEIVQGQDSDAPIKFKQVVVEDAALKQPAFTMLI